MSLLQANDNWWATNASWCECCNHYTAKGQITDNWCYDCTERH